MLRPFIAAAILLGLAMPAAAQNTINPSEMTASAALYEAMAWAESQPDLVAPSRCKLMTLDWPLGAFVDDTIASRPMKYLADGNGYTRPRSASPANPRTYDIPWNPERGRDWAAWSPLTQTVVCYVQYAVAMSMAVEAMPKVVSTWNGDRTSPALNFSVRPIDGHSATVPDKQSAVIIAATTLAAAFKTPEFPERVMKAAQHIQNICAVPDYMMVFTDRNVTMNCGALQIQPWLLKATWDGKPMVGPDGTMSGDYVFKLGSAPRQ